MGERYSVKHSHMGDDVYLSIYDSESMTYNGLFDLDDDNELDDVCKLVNSLDDELKHTEEELATLQRYMPIDKHALMKENIKLRGLLKYQEGVYNLEKKYFAECLLALIEEYPESSGLLAFKDVVGW
ncbi:hypothetical protein [Methanobrevibacter sp.]|uniref:hypothetical protein n=1 Tax=Methanobrevibacter sp. TaxID=66852 RepID=UPI003863E0F8